MRSYLQELTNSLRNNKLRTLPHWLLYCLGYHRAGGDAWGW